MTKKQKIFSTIIFVVLLILAINRCSNILEYKKAREKYIPFYESKTNFDVIYIGTSHVYNGILPMEMWSNYGIASYNWGYSNCTPAESYYLIQDIIKFTSPKVVILDGYGLCEYEGYNNGKYCTNEIEQQHIQYDSLPLSMNKIRAAKDVFDDYDNNEDFIWNFIMYHNRWSELDQSDFEYNVNRQKGAELLTGLGSYEFSRISSDEKTEIDSICYPYYVGILDFCEQKEIQVLCTYLPFGAEKRHQMIANTIGDTVEQYPNAKYINMLNENIIDFDTDIYSDNSHLNYSGACKVTKWIGKYLVEHYELGDYSKNEDWINDYEAYYEFKKEQLISSDSLTDYLIWLSDPDFEASAEIYDDRLANSEELMNLFTNADISPMFCDGETQYDVCLTIRSTRTNEIIETANFLYDEPDDLDIFQIKTINECASCKKRSV